MHKAKNGILGKSLRTAILFILCFMLTACSEGEHTHAKSELIVDNPVFGGNEDSSWSGDRIYLGSFEQDGDETNGAEPILWRILTVDGKKALLLSEYALRTMPYNSEWTDTTWETSDVRKWLNGEFFEASFTQNDKSLIIKTAISTKDNLRYGTDGGNDTEDHVFLLQWEDTYNEEYGFVGPERVKNKKRRYDKTIKAQKTDENSTQLAALSIGRVCYPTIAAAEQRALITRESVVRKNHKGNKIEGFGSSYWLLRTPGKVQKSVSYVSRWGKTAYSFNSPVDHVQSTIRPAMWANFDGVEIMKVADGYYTACSDEAYLKAVENAKDYRQEILNLLTNEPEGPAYTIAGTKCSNIDELKNPTFGGNSAGEWEGDRVYFGEWNGKRIPWRVLSVDDDKIMLLSEYALFSRKFDKNEGNEWSEATIRTFLNKKFISKAFTADEAKLLVSTKLKAEVDPRYGTSSGSDTEDKVFMLSYSDIMNEAYGFTGPDPNYGNGPTDSNSRVCYMLKDADRLEGLATTEYFGRSDRDGNLIYAVKDYVVMWTTRTAGFTEYQMHSVNRWGDAYCHEMHETTKKVHIRPAIVIDKKAAELTQESEDKYPTLVLKQNEE